MFFSPIRRFAASRLTSSAGRPFNVLMIGAGPVNFGTPEGPWDHTPRSETHVVGIVERDPLRADRVLSIKRADETARGGYKDTKVFSSIQEAGATLRGDSSPQLAVVGIQAFARGSTRTGRDTELQLIHQFPQIGLLIEKPISADDFSQVESVAQSLEKANTITSVGYMLRYLQAVKEMKRLIAVNKLNIMATNSRFLMAYQSAAGEGATRNYWDKRLELGPIVGQGTHLVDLVRYLAPKVQEETLHVNTIEPTDPAGYLSEIKFDEKKIVEPDQRIPRMTHATWRYKNGGLGSFLHGCVLHDGDYDCEVVVLADGWLMRLTDIYGTNPTLHVRRPGTNAEVATVFANDDCYYTEVAAVVDAIEGTGPKSAILSTYEDAMESYKMTWEIRLAGEAAAKARGVDPAIDG
ncbi:hypothetical protein TREMEDRAFT_68146 [Tremella mesenterica DSM 1558]|uniref:uncharacterized protein n=1 Tax=Tremella mesenterica (strain ATCC 24925 / CBS 8224 / DSM 1558 / NBRC 9311 / NRRL Y-6157 / RJB 2259-6 / UBC 559-6) TaxID=578456 RepID=UPI0003F4A375|nr:uncharacterized protein TREMEDRAFT_68146 [Tremella mesenterica DSM 1558]EIW70639.1 hypothetical protein TREMEDRAFT_68146 [Tremella mesenterica DSM 1558]